MDEMQFYDSSMAAPVIVSPIADPLPHDDSFWLEWNNIAGATLYEVWTDDGPLFVNAN